MSHRVPRILRADRSKDTLNVVTVSLWEVEMNRLVRFLLVVVCLVAVLVVATDLSFREFDFGTSLPEGFPSDIPIVPGTIASCTTARSDDLVRVVEVRIHSALSFADTVTFYRDAFAVRATEHWNIPEFPLAGPDATETSSNALFGRNQVSVFVQVQGGATDVLVQVRGTSLFTLPR
jgi:hypothetical protein